jgi:hypothetical protein
MRSEDKIEIFCEQTGEAPQSITHVTDRSTKEVVILPIRLKVKKAERSGAQEDGFKL